MRRFFVGRALTLAGAVIGLLVSSVVFSGFDLSADGFLVAVLIFAVLDVVLPFVVLRALARAAGPAVPLTGLAATFLALLITDLASRGLSISGLTAWIGATLLIWVLSMVLWLVPGPWRTFRRGEPAARHGR